MAIELRQTLKLTQQLLITPQLQQAIKLLQLSRMELVETVQKELLENPVLEEGVEPENIPVENTVATERMSDLSTATGSETDGPTATQESMPQAEGEQGQGEQKDFDWGSYLESNNRPSREFRTNSGNSEEIINYENMITRPSSLHDHLEWQAHLSNLSLEEEEACQAIIGNIDDNGYLQATLEEIADKTEYGFNALEDALCVVQDLDPVGVGARDLKECLSLQIRHHPDRKPLGDIIANYLHFIERRDFVSLGKKLGLPMKRVIELAQTIYALEPKPGRPFSTQVPQYITPDVYIHLVGEEYVVVLNEDGLPKLQISNFYKTAIMKELAAAKNGGDGKPTSEADSKAQGYIQEKLKSALWLIKSIHQRQKTLYKVTKAIVKFQREFFDKGVQCLKPLVLRDVADEIGVHESTVSRATNNKFVHSPQGIFELKYFFNTGLSNSAGGQDFANEAVKQLVRKFIGEESTRSPLSDQAIAKMLQGHNIDIARRTVAKYREMLGILPSSRRKQVC